MRNQLALSGEKILEKIYPQLFHHVGMIRGEYLLRELNQNIILASCQQFVKDYLETICSLYSDEEVWYRFTELTNTEANCLVGTKEFFDEGHPLFGYRGTRRLLACLVFKGEKTATASAYDLYVLEDEPLPQVGTFDVILDSQNQSVCIVEITKVSVELFNQVSAQHAFKEGEGDKSLAYWRQVHEDFFTDCLGEVGLTFTPESKVVLEEFRKVYPL
ncbi:TPA: ASCH domain-containing protein [Streptococcus pneumoniae]